MNAATKNQICNDFAVVVTNYNVGETKLEDRVYNFTSDELGSKAACNKAYAEFDEQCTNDLKFYMNSGGSKSILLIINGKIHKTFSIKGTNVI